MTNGLTETLDQIVETISLSAEKTVELAKGVNKRFKQQEDALIQTINTATSLAESMRDHVAKQKELEKETDRILSDLEERVRQLEGERG